MALLFFSPVAIQAIEFTIAPPPPPEEVEASEKISVTGLNLLILFPALFIMLLHHSKSSCKLSGKFISAS